MLVSSPSIQLISRKYISLVMLVVSAVLKALGVWM